MKEGWRSRGYLPHFDVPGLVQVLTFRLNDALPPMVIERLREVAEDQPAAKREAEIRRLKERWLDAGHGACWLGQPQIAESTEQKMLATDGERCLLLAWTIMPNHVDAVVEHADDVPLGIFFGSGRGRAPARRTSCSVVKVASGFPSTTTDSSETQRIWPTRSATAMGTR